MLPDILMEIGEGTLKHFFKLYQRFGNYLNGTFNMNNDYEIGLTDDMLKRSPINDVTLVFVIFLSNTILAVSAFK